MSHGLATTDAPATLPSGGLRRVVGAVLLVLLVIWTWLVLRAPIDGMQGVVQKILYVHPACAFAAYLGFGITAFAGAMYLWRDDEAWDRRAAAAAEVGVLFCTLVILTGPVWARGTWGHWWSWDPRLIVTLVLWFIYLAYALLRSFTEGSERAARFAAVYGIVGLLAVPLNYVAIDLFGDRAIHPENLQGDSLGSGMGAPFAAGAATLLLAFVYLYLLRLEVGELRAAALSRASER